MKSIREFFLAAPSIDETCVLWLKILAASIRLDPDDVL
jgi:hypothetical protein